MKKLIIIAVALTSAQALYGQLNTAWPANVSTATPAGYVGIGTKPTTTHVNPNFNLHLHGTTDVTITQPINFDGSGGGVANLGKTVRLGFTNSTTGLLSSDGTVLRMSNNDFVLHNQEATGTISFRSGTSVMDFLASTGQIWVGRGAGTPFNSTPGNFNIYASSNRNGLYIRSNNTGLNYGFRIQMKNAAANAIEVFHDIQADDKVNFRVKTNGEVFARRYTTTLNNIPDYVFEPNYKLLTLDELRSYITTNKHLPNVPSANEFAETGVDLGELNRLLLEKVEELTLYILQLEERTKRLEDQK
jgi:hypothetical protein